MATLKQLSELTQMALHLKKGALHKDLGVPKGSKIPAEKLVIKDDDSPLLKKRKQFAINAKSWKHESISYDSFKEFIDELEEQEFQSFLMEEYDTTLDEMITDFDKGAEKMHPKDIKSQLEHHVDAHYNKSPEARKRSVIEAKKYFKDTDLRTEEEKTHGETYKKQREEHNSKSENTNHQMPESIFEHPLKYSGEAVSSTTKHKMSGVDYKIPEGEHKGKGAVVGGIRLSPGAANMGHGKMLRTCPAATKGCEGGGAGAERQESGIFKSGLCLAANKGMDTTIDAKKNKLARTRALADPKHQTHGAALLASGLEKFHKRAEKEDSVAHLRQRDSSDIDLTNGIREKHFGEHPSWKKGEKNTKAAPMKAYGYSKYAADNGPDEHKEHITRSDTGPEFNSKGESIPGNRERKNKTIEHLKGGAHTRAYMVMGARRSSKTRGTEKDIIKDIHTVRYHKYDENGNHIGHEDFDADKNLANGDLRQYDKKATRNTHDVNGREKGAVTITDISGGSGKDSGTGKHAGEEANPMVHPLTPEHITADPEHPGKNIYHVDPPQIKRKHIIPIKAI